jgi:hypothetical protein
LNHEGGGVTVLVIHDVGGVTTLDGGLIIDGGGIETKDIICDVGETSLGLIDGLGFGLGFGLMNGLSLILLGCADRLAKLFELGTKLFVARDVPLLMETGLKKSLIAIWLSKGLEYLASASLTVVVPFGIGFNPNFFSMMAVL